MVDGGGFAGPRSVVVLGDGEGVVEDGLFLYGCIAIMV